MILIDTVGTHTSAAVTGWGRIGIHCSGWNTMYGESGSVDPRIESYTDDPRKKRGENAKTGIRTQAVSGLGHNPPPIRVCIKWIVD